MTGTLLETDRLRIRPWRHEEAPRLLDILSREEVMRWLGDGPVEVVTELEEVHRRIDRYAARSAAPPCGVWAIEVAATGLVAGTVLLVPLPGAEAGEIEVGWHLHPDSWGRGYASEAARAVLDHAFGSGLDEVLAVCHLDNERSMAVMRRIGMQDRGVVEKWYEGPSRLFGATAAQWRGAGGPG